MRRRLLQDLAVLEPVEWAAIVGEDALPVEVCPAEDVADAVARWASIESRVGRPQRLLVRGEEANLASHRIDATHLLLIRFRETPNIGGLRHALAEAAERLVDLV